jgi:hypothetical protein
MYRRNIMISLKKILKEDDLDKYSPGRVPDDKSDQPENNFLDYDELDVEEEDEEDFLLFLKSYTSEMNESKSIKEAEYQGREVKLGKPMQGDVKKFKVYVKNPQGNVVKVNFGAKGMNIKKNNPERRKSFRARHNCDNPGPRHMARYWSCRKW